MSLVSLMLTVLTIASASLFSREPDPALLETLGRATPEAGAVEVLYLRGEYPQEIRAGFDFASGAAYSVSTGGYFCREAGGRTIMHSAVDNQLREWSDSQHLMSKSVSGMIPQVWAWVLRRHPDWITSSSQKDGLTQIEFRVPEEQVTPGVPPPPTLRVTLDAQGRVTRVGRAADSSADSQPSLDFDPRSPQGLPLPSVNPQGDKLMSVQWHEHPGDRFTAPRVTALASQFRADVEKHRQLSRAARKAAQAPGGASPDTARPPEPEPEGSEYQWVVFGTGALCALVGVGAIWWKRRR